MLAGGRVTKENLLWLVLLAKIRCARWYFKDTEVYAPASGWMLQFSRADQREGSGRVHSWYSMTGAHGNWSSLHGVDGHWGSLDSDRVWALDGGGEERSVGWGRGHGAWLVGLDSRVEAGGVGHVVHEAGDTEGIDVAIGANLVVELISGLLTGHAGAELVDVVEPKLYGWGGAYKDSHAQPQHHRPHKRKGSTEESATKRWTVIPLKGKAKLQIMDLNAEQFSE
ncbi:unnamed protein product [Ixodes persulcatus]